MGFYEALLEPEVADAQDESTHAEEVHTLLDHVLSQITFPTGDANRPPMHWRQSVHFHGLSRTSPR